MNQTAKWVVGLIIVAVLAIVLYTISERPETAEGGRIKIGFIGPLTGDAASIGEQEVLAIEIARDEVNAAGGVNGKQIEVIFEDGQCNPQSAVNAANKLINVDKVSLIIGAGCSSETLAVAPLAEQAKVLLFSPVSTNPKITDAGDYVFRNVPSDSFQGVFAAEYLKNVLGKSKVALLKCLSDWCLGVNDAFKKKFQELGGQIVAEESYQQDSRDLRTQLTKIKTAAPEVIYFVGYTEASIAGIRQAKELGLAATIFGADAWSDPKIWSELGRTADGAMYSEPANKTLPESFVAEMNRRSGGKEINVYAPRAYDAFKILASLIAEKGVNSTAIKNALYNLKNYQGIADNYTFDRNGDVTGASYAVKRVENGKVVDVK